MHFLSRYTLYRNNMACLVIPFSRRVQSVQVVLYTIPFYYSLAGISSLLSFLGTLVIAWLRVQLQQSHFSISGALFPPMLHPPVATNYEDDFLKVAYFRAMFLQDVGPARNSIRKIETRVFLLCSSIPFSEILLEIINTKMP